MSLLFKVLLSLPILSSHSIDGPRMDRRRFLQITGSAVGLPDTSVVRILADPIGEIRSFPLKNYPAGFATEIVGLPPFPKAPEWIVNEATRRGVPIRELSLEIVDTELQIAREFDLNPRDVHAHVLEIFGIEQTNRPLPPLGGDFHKFMADVIRHTSANATTMNGWTEGIWSEVPISSLRDWDSLPEILRDRVGPSMADVADTGWYRWKHGVITGTAPPVVNVKGGGTYKAPKKWENPLKRMEREGALIQNCSMFL